MSPPTPGPGHTWAYLRTTCTALTPGCSSLCGGRRGGSMAGERPAATSDPSPGGPARWTNPLLPKATEGQGYCLERSLLPFTHG